MAEKIRTATSGASGLMGSLYDEFQGANKEDVDVGRTASSPYVNPEAPRQELFAPGKPEAQYNPNAVDPRPSNSSGGGKSDNESDSSGGGGFSASSALDDLGYANKDAFKAATGYSSVEQYLKDREGKLGKEIESSFDPIFDELDRQLGALPGRQREFEENIGRSAEAQLGDIETQRVFSTDKLESERSKGLRSLEDDIRNLMSAAGRKIGAAGAGSSSAAIQASEAVARAGQRSRGSLIESVVGKIAEVNNIATQQRSQINQWKSDRLFDIGQYFASQFDAIRGQMANAKGERSRALTQMKQGLEQQFTDYLISLDNQVRQYAQQVDMWERSRAAQAQQGLQSIQGMEQSFDIRDFKLVEGADGMQYFVAPGQEPIPAGIRVAQPEEDPTIRNAGPLNEPYRVVTNDSGEVSLEPIQGFSYTQLPQF